MTYKSVEIEPGHLLSKIKRSGNSLINNKLFSALLKAERISVQPTTATGYLNTLSKLSAKKKILGYQDSTRYKVDELVSVLEDYDIKYNMTEFTL